MEPSIKRLPTEDPRPIYDVVIVGSGIAGLYTALQLDASLSILLASKEDLLMGNTSLAQGGIAAVMHTNPDSTSLHVQDTLVAGGHQNNREAVTVMAQEAAQEIRSLMAFGVEFDQLADGADDLDNKVPWHMTLEGGHSFPRILHYRDATGKEMATKLLAQTAQRDNVTLAEHCMVAAMERTSDENLFEIALVQIATAAPSVQQLTTVYARYCVLATGGIGRIYQHTTNAKSATGDGIMLAHQLGAKIARLDAIQFHPTGFAKERAPQQDASEGNSADTFLISEAVRGEGALLYNAEGERFLSRYDARLELAPRDVVSRAMILEAQRIGKSGFDLDITAQDPVRIREHFPVIDEKLRACGIDMTTDRIPVYPCQHYVMGGIDVTLAAETSVNRLYAVGECSHTGVHGNNRLASNSLLESVVFARHAAEDINRRIEREGRFTQAPLNKRQSAFAKRLANQQAAGTAVPTHMSRDVQTLMQQAFFVFPNWERVETGLAEVLQWKEQLEQGGYRLDRPYLETYSMVVVAQIVLQSLLERRATTEAPDQAASTL